MGPGVWEAVWQGPRAKAGREGLAQVQPCLSLVGDVGKTASTSELRSPQKQKGHKVAMLSSSCEI